jgi:hypothetical protein
MEETDKQADAMIERAEKDMYNLIYQAIRLDCNCFDELFRRNGPPGDFVCAHWVKVVANDIQELVEPWDVEALAATEKVSIHHGMREEDDKDRGYFYGDTPINIGEEFVKEISEIVRALPPGDLDIFTRHSLEDFVYDFIIRNIEHFHFRYPPTILRRGCRNCHELTVLSTCVNCLKNGFRW